MKLDQHCGWQWWRGVGLRKIVRVLPNGYSASPDRDSSSAAPLTAPFARRSSDDNRPQPVEAATRLGNTGRKTPGRWERAGAGCTWPRMFTTVKATLMKIGTVGQFGTHLLVPVKFLRPPATVAAILMIRCLQRQAHPAARASRACSVDGTQGSVS